MGLNKRFISTEAAGPSVVATDNFAPVLYTGNGSTQSISSLDFQPDFVWLKSRSFQDNHYLQDSVRGATRRIHSNLNVVEQAPDANRFTSFDTNGFTVGSDNSTNQSGQTFVAWCWKGGGAAVSNTNGTITSQVSANQAAGFSIVKYTGDSTEESATAGHGLSEAPQLIFTKNLNGSARDWVVYCSEAPAANVPYGGRLNSTAAFFTAPQFVGNSGVPTSSVLTFQSGTYPFQVIQNGVSYIAYCFHSVSGYQKVGSYTGTGTTGNSITTGFQPRFLIIKSSSNAEPWFILDSVRDASNPRDNRLMADSDAAETDGSVHTVDFSSTGFTANGTLGNGTNGSGVTYIYLAIA